MRNYFRAIEHHPCHLSVGAVVLNDDGNVMCHHFPTFVHNGRLVNNLYLLLRETPQPNESLETAVQRGAMEEFGAKIEIKEFLGSIISSFPSGDFEFDKTTVYFQCQLKSLDESKRKEGDVEAISKIEFLPVNELIEKMKAQSEKYHRSDWNEIKVLERVKR